MGFEIFSRKIQRSGSPSVSFNKLGRMSFNKAATTQFEKDAVENALLMWDVEKRLVGIRPITKKDSRAYRVHYGKKGNGCSFAASTFLRFIGYKEVETKSMPARWDEQQEMFLIEVPEQYLEGGKQEIVHPVVRERKRRGPKQS